MPLDTQNPVGSTANAQASTDRTSIADRSTDGVTLQGKHGLADPADWQCGPVCLEPSCEPPITPQICRTAAHLATPTRPTRTASNSKLTPARRTLQRPASMTSSAASDRIENCVCPPDRDPPCTHGDFVSGLPARVPSFARPFAPTTASEQLEFAHRRAGSPPPELQRKRLRTNVSVAEQPRPEKRPIRIAAPSNSPTLRDEVGPLFGALRRHNGDADTQALFQATIHCLLSSVAPADRPTLAAHGFKSQYS
jgi:hypothetical protein